MKKCIVILTIIAMVCFCMLTTVYATDENIEKPDPVVDPEPEPEPESVVDPDPKPTPEPEPESEPDPVVDPDPETDTVVDPEPTDDPEENTEPEPTTELSQNSNTNTQTNPSEEEEEEELTTFEQIVKQISEGTLDSGDISLIESINVNVKLSSSTLTATEKQNLGKLTAEEIEKKIQQIKEIVETVSFEPNETALNAFKEKLGEEAEYVALNFIGHINLDFTIDLTITIPTDKELSSDKTYYIYHYNEDTKEIEVLGEGKVTKGNNGEIYLKFSTKSFSDFFVSEQDINILDVKTTTSVSNTIAEDVNVDKDTPLWVLIVLIGALMAVIITWISIVRKK